MQARRRIDVQGEQAPVIAERNEVLYLEILFHRL